MNVQEGIESIEGGKRLLEMNLAYAKQRDKALVLGKEIISVLCENEELALAADRHLLGLRLLVATDLLLIMAESVEKVEFLHELSRDFEMYFQAWKLSGKIEADFKPFIERVEQDDTILELQDLVETGDKADDR